MKKIKESWLIKGVIGFFAVSVVFVFITAAQATYITNYIKPVQVGLPVANTDAATKAYVDTVIAANGGKQIWYKGLLGDKRCLPKSKIIVYDNVFPAVLPTNPATVITWLCTDSSEEICWENDANPALSSSIVLRKPFGVAGYVLGPTTTPYCVAENFVIE